MSKRWWTEFKEVTWCCERSIPKSYISVEKDNEKMTSMCGQRCDSREKGAGIPRNLNKDLK